MENLLGYLDANDERERQGFFPASFVRTKSIQKALHPDRPFVCGRRGAGKSAIAYELSLMLRGEKPQYAGYIYIAREQYEHLHQQIVRDILTHPCLNRSTGDDIEAFFFEIWTYILNLASFHCAAQVADSYKIPKDRAKFILDYIDGNGGLTTSPPEKTIYNVIDCMRQVHDEAAPITEFVLALRQLQKGPGFQAARDATLSVFSKFTGVVAIDTIEAYRIEEPYLRAWRGMCHAVKEFQLSGKYGRLSIKCFLPAELTGMLFRENLAKYNDHSVYLQWSYAELLEFIARRYVIYLANTKDRKSVQLSKELSDVIESFSSNSRNAHVKDFWREKFWNRFFPVRIKNRYGWLEDSAAYIIRHTQKRPREILACMNFIVAAAIDNNESPLISSESIISGIHHPDNLHQLLTDNLSIFNLPMESDATVSIHEVAETIFANASVTFSGSKLKDFAKRAFRVLTRDEAIADEFAIDLALRSGLIGTVNVPPRQWLDPDSGESCKYYITKFEYCIPGRVTWNETSLCAVHPMLADQLGLTDPDGYVVYHLPEPTDLVANLSTDGV